MALQNGLQHWLTVYLIAFFWNVLVWNYCSISFNSAGPLTRYRPAENLVSALSEFSRDKARIRQYSAAGHKILLYWDWSPNSFGTWKNCPLQPLHFGKFQGCMTRYCQIEWNSTVESHISVFASWTDFLLCTTGSITSLFTVIFSLVASDSGSGIGRIVPLIKLCCIKVLCSNDPRHRTSTERSCGRGLFKSLSWTVSVIQRPDHDFSCEPAT